MRITIELRRPARRTAALLLAVLTLAIPGVALASHQYSDVPANHPFHAEIGAIAGAGITGGFSDGTYRPDNVVTRQAMAAFMERGFGRVALAIGSPSITLGLDVAAGSTSAAAVPVRQVTITVPGTSNAFSPKQLVHLEGGVRFYTSMSTTNKGCMCTFYAQIRDMATNAVSVTQFDAFESSYGYPNFYGFDVQALLVVSPGPRTFQLEVGLDDRFDETNATAFGFDTTSSLNATTFPFGATDTTDF
jgi:hypothetical protein